MGFRFSGTAWKMTSRTMRRHAAWSVVPLAALILLTSHRMPGSLVWPLAFALAAVLLLYFAHVVAGLAALVYGAQLEVRRKIVHVCVGVTIVGVAVMTASVTALIAACSGIAAWQIFSRRFKGPSMLHSLLIDRPGVAHSYGDVLMPLGMGLSFLIAGSATAPWLFASTVLIVADAAAAIVGTKWGCHRYRVVGGASTKSLEGSASFVAAAWMLGLIFLLPVLDTATWLGVAWTLLLACMLAACEAVCVRGSDNLVLPFAAVLAATHVGVVAATVCLFIVLLAPTLGVVWASGARQVRDR